MDLSSKYLHANYSLGGIIMGELRTEQYLGVLVDHRHSNSMWCQVTANKVIRKLSKGYLFEGYINTFTPLQSTASS